MLIAVSFLSIRGYAQEGTLKVKGKVLDTEKDPLVGVSIYTQDRKNFCISENDGSFEISTYLTDTLIFSMIGYNRVYFSVREIHTPLLVRLKNNLMLSELVIVSPEPLSTNFSTIKMDQMAIYLNPVADGDAFKAINLLPYSTTEDESASPSLRGSKPNRTIVLLNGVPVRNPVKYTELSGIGGFGLFSPEVIKEEVVYASNPPVIYGNSSAGAVEIKTIDRVDNNSLQLSAHLSGNGLFLNTQPTKKISAQVFANTQYSDAFLKINRIPDVKKFNTLDLGTNLSFDIKDNQKIKLYIYGISENYKAEYSMYSYTNDSKYGNDRFFAVSSYVNINKRGVLTVNNLIDLGSQTVQFGNADFQNNTQRYYTGINYKFDFKKNLSMVGGSTFEYIKDKVFGEFPSIYYAMSPNSPKTKNDTIDNLKTFEAYLYTKWNITPNLSLSLGARTNIPFENQTYYLNRQIALKYDLKNNHTFLLGVGKYYNYSLFDQYTLKYYLLESTQYTLDYSFENRDILFSSAIYYKNESGNSKLLDDYYTDNNTNNELFGVELFYQQHLLKNFKYSVGYTFLDSKIMMNNKKFNGKNDYPYLLKLTVTNMNKYFTTSASYITRDGNYYTDIISATHDHATGFFKPVYGKYNANRYNKYHLLSLSFTKTMEFKGNMLIAYLTLNNILNRDNNSSIYYSNNYKQKMFYSYSPFIFYIGFNYKFIM
jgi:hypothetical protein